MNTVQFNQWLCNVNVFKYENDRIALTLSDAFDGEPIATCTVNLPGESCPDGYVFIKEWSENKGMTNALVDAEIVESTGIEISVGPYGAKANLCKLLI